MSHSVKLKVLIENDSSIEVDVLTSDLPVPHVIIDI